MDTCGEASGSAAGRHEGAGPSGWTIDKAKVSQPIIMGPVSGKEASMRCIALRHGRGHGHSSGRQLLAFPERSRSRAEAGRSAVSCAERMFNVRAPAVDPAPRRCRHPLGLVAPS
jgi:hypothetical protein